MKNLATYLNMWCQEGVSHLNRFLFDLIDVQVCKILLLASCLLVFHPRAHAQNEPFVTVKRHVVLMGSSFEISVVAPGEEIGYINIDEAVAEIKRIEKMISSWDTESETSLINRNAGISPVKISYELFKLIERSIQISEITDGAFDITYAPLEELWKYDGSLNALPSPEEIKEVTERVGYQHIVLNRAQNTVFLKKKGMKLSFGAIGKGYAADRAKALLMSKRVVAGMINAGGDVTCWGNRADGSKWTVRVGLTKQGEKGSWIMPVVESSIATVSSLLKYETVNGKRYSHLIDPKTGYPVSGIDKVHVFGKTAELCDALATAVMVMGPEKGMALINQLGGTEVLFFDSLGDAHSSNGLLLPTP